MTHKYTFQTPFFSINTVAFNRRLGECGTPDEDYWVVNTGNSAICCVLDESDSFVFIRQYRPPLGVWTIEMPSGSIEEYESPYEGATRELKEEVGVSCELIQIPGSYSMMTSRCSGSEYIFFGMNPILSKDFVAEDGTSVVYVKRRMLPEMITNSNYIQLAGLGAMFAISTAIGLDLIASSYNDIHSSFRNYSRRRTDFFG